MRRANWLFKLRHFRMVEGNILAPAAAFSKVSPDRIFSSDPSRMSSAAMAVICGFVFKWLVTN